MKMLDISIDIFVPKGSIDNMSALVQVMARRETHRRQAII